MQKIAENVLSTYAFFRDGSPELRAELLKHSKVLDREHLAGDHLFMVGDVCDSASDNPGDACTNDGQCTNGFCDPVYRATIAVRV